MIPEHTAPYWLVMHEQNLANVREMLKDPDCDYMARAMLEKLAVILERRVAENREEVRVGVLARMN